MLQRLTAVVMMVFLACSGLGCGSKARSSADAAPGAGAGGRSGAGGAHDGGTTDGGASGSGGMGGSGGGGGGGGGTASGGSGGGGSGGGGSGGGGTGGSMVPTCTPNVPCTPNLPCKTGTVSCDAGVARCVATGDQPNGTLCGTNVSCVNGFCDNEGCGHACTPSNRCHTGTISCTTGTNICQDTGASVPDGTSCGTDQACKSGACVTCSVSDGGCSS